MTSEVEVTSRGGGVVTITGAAVIDDDVLGDVSEAEVKVEDDNEDDDIDVCLAVDKAVDEIEFEEHEDPKRVANTVTGTLTVSIAGTLTVAVLPESFGKSLRTNSLFSKIGCVPGRVTNEVVIVG